MNVSLKPELEQFVVERVKAGRYADPSAIVNEALEMLKDQEDFAPEHAAGLRRELQRGLEQLDRGEYSNFDAETIIVDERGKQSGVKRPT